MWETEGRVWSCRMRAVRALGVVDEESARARSGVSRTRRVFRAEEEVREEMAVESVVLRCGRSREVRAKWPGVEPGAAVGGDAGGDGVVALGGAGWRAGCVGAGGPRAGTMRPGGPRTGSVWPALCDCKPVSGCCGRNDACCACCARGCSPMTSPLSPSTNANRFSFLSRSRSRPPPFRASCLQKS